jgi:hypothetical protein
LENRKSPFEDRDEGVVQMLTAQNAPEEIYDKPVT